MLGSVGSARALGIVGALVVTVGGTAAAAPPKPAPVIVTMQSHGRVRVQVSEGTTMPCDSTDDRMLFDATLGPDESFQSSIAGRCICVRHTTDAFPQNGWTTSKLACSPNCPRGFGRRCTDPTIRVLLDARDGK